MPNLNYLQALTRSDLSQWVVHFVRGAGLISPTRMGTAADILDSIFCEGRIRPSMHEYVTRFCQEGAACFYDAPPSIWPEIAITNPNQRPPIGIICHKNALWALGGRPVIYTDVLDGAAWPEHERFRLVYTDLSRNPQPVDWTHEREWRVRGGLALTQSFPCIWWWPIVPNYEWLDYLFTKYQSLVSIYVIEENTVVTR